MYKCKIIKKTAIKGIPSLSYSDYPILSLKPEIDVIRTGSDRVG